MGIYPVFTQGFYVSLSKTLQGQWRHWQRIVNYLPENPYSNPIPCINLEHSSESFN